jgi:hypothetical protein
MKDKINGLATHRKIRKFETYIEEKINLRRVTNLELTW